jgi:ABC-2 type transport system ATP-binding protein/lipopolysaccharide transport system ATP-binding protein
MVGIELERAGVSIPVYNASARSLRSDVLRRVGGGLAAKQGDVLRIEALREVTLSLRPGDRVALVGHNGAGKSTLLRVCSGAYEPSSGRARIAGRVAALLDIGLGMEAELTGRENIALRAACMGMGAAETREREAEIEAFCELGPFIDMPLRTYSAGMALRLAFAVSTAWEADILLLDEMITVGDPGFAAKAHARMEALMSRAAIMVLATHDTAILRQWCNRAIRLDAGRVVQDGTVEEVVG